MGRPSVLNQSLRHCSSPETSHLLSEAELWLGRKFLTSTDKDNLFTIDHFPLWYRLAVENTPGSFFYYPVTDKGQSSCRHHQCVVLDQND